MLQDMPIFGGIDEQALNYLLDHAPCIVVSRGKHFFREGELATSMFVLEVGQVVVYRTWQGARYPLRTLDSGDCFGEVSLIDCQLRSASVEATQDCRAIQISTGLFAKIYEEYPQQFTLIYMNLGRELCRRLRDSDARLFVQQRAGH